MLEIKYRSETLNELEGNEELKAGLEAIFKRKKKDIPHAFLITGPSGCGKTTVAYHIRDMLECKKQDFYELNTADFKGIDTIRNIRENMKYKGFSGGIRIYFLDEGHKLTNDAQNAILKMLEQAPKHVYFIIATTEPQKLIITLKRRCSPFEVKPVDEGELQDYLHWVVESEKKKVPDKVLRKIAIKSNGSIGIALQNLDRIIDLPEKAMEKAALHAVTTEEQTLELCRELVSEKGTWKQVAEILNTHEGEAEETRLAIIGYCAKILLKGKQNKRAFLIMACMKDPFYNNGKNGLVLACYDIMCGG